MAARWRFTRSDGSVAGSWPAISGKNGDQRPSSQNRPFEGPLTEGKYSFSIDNIQPMTTLDAAKGVEKWEGRYRGLFPGSMPAWGTERVELAPNSSSVSGRNTSAFMEALRLARQDALTLARTKKHISTLCALRENRLMR